MSKITYSVYQLVFSRFVKNLIWDVQVVILLVMVQFYFSMVSAMVEWIERKTPIREDPGSKPAGV